MKSLMVFWVNTLNKVMQTNEPLPKDLPQGWWTE
jgi:hypothetical protein